MSLLSLKLALAPLTMEPRTLKVLQRLRTSLGLPPIALLDVRTDPIAETETIRGAARREILVG
jgi:hypothetical protein